MAIKRNAGTRHVGRRHVGRLCLLTLLLGARAASGQALETVGSRAAGMAGAFVAVASDSSAVWWNPAALPTGPLADMSIGFGDARKGEPVPGAAGRTTALAVALPLLGVHVASYDHVRVANRRGGDTAVSRVAVRQVGLTLVQSIVSGVHVGGTLKYLRGAWASDRRFVDGGQAIAAARALSGSDAEGRWDADLGVMAVRHGWRVGLLARQLMAPSFGQGAEAIRAGRQVRAGVAFDAAEAGGPPLIVAADVDLTGPDGPDGLSRAAAVGVERWLRGGQIGLRTGFRVSTAGDPRPAASAGASLMVKSGLFLEVSGTAGSNDAPRSWGATARISF
ncbi:MAG: hypothetical protein Q7J25_06100 [Vicinamibacterales bacterium]|nr:hypothetical protein [Vicinamibacterales bacterium]